jgi:1,4-alpha-glucan branching enzyme
MSYMYVTFVLHAHLPYVRHKEADRLEERWLYEAITETYIPLLWNLEKENQLNKWTISFSPPLMEMLSDPLIQRRYLQFLEKTESLLLLEENRVKNDKEKVLVQFYKDRYKKIKETFLKWNQNILQGYKYYFSKGDIECITSSATHTFLPYLQTDQGLKMQIKNGVSCFKKHFNVNPNGIWLPECAFTPGIDKVLHEEGIRFTFVDEHTIQYADPTPSKGRGAPIYSPHGIVLFPRNQELSNKVWSSVDGYPGDVDYREFYRDIAYDREFEYIKPFIHPDGIRIDTGLKFNRVTGLDQQKDYYVPNWAKEKVKSHAEHFTSVLQDELWRNGNQSFPPYTVLLPFDAELFGHWWFEGPDWVQEMLTKEHLQVEWITPTEVINRHFQDLETSHIAFGTWGRNGYGDVWLNEKNEWMYRHMHQMERKLVEIASKANLEDELTNKTIQQLARDWMLATSSDWAFIVDNESANQYAINRFKEHVQRYYSLLELFENNLVSEECLMNLHSDYPLFSNIDITSLITQLEHYIKKTKLKETHLKNILILSWEFPPNIVGGLARHVFELSRSLVKQGHHVVVITTKNEFDKEYEIIEGIHVFRVPAYQYTHDHFLHWIGSLNLNFLDKARELFNLFNFDLIHAHDWLVASSAITLKKSWEIPLVTTIHATERGRNNGIYTSLQSDIQDKEIKLIQSSDQVIVCSDYMKNEIMDLVPEVTSKIFMIPNGVDLSFFETRNAENTSDRQREEDSQYIVFSFGRMVPEKGFQYIIDAVPTILKKFNNVHFILAGEGPLQKKYYDAIKKKGLSDKVKMLGFINDQERNEYLRNCDIAVFPSLYEPFGIAALEAMVSGTPVIASHTGGLPSFVKNGLTGITISPGSVEELSKGIIALLANPKLSRKLAENGQKLALQQYNWDYIAHKTSLCFDLLFTKEEVLI